MATTMESFNGPAAGAEHHQQRQSMRPRSKSAFSITSDKSQNSRRSAGEKEKFRESHDEKRKLAFSNTTKANPNAAMNELQPIAQQLEKATIGSLRASQYLDMHGAPITDPDFSNPTRRRTERPLETIMSFEAAIDREYRRQREAAKEAARQSFIETNPGAQDKDSYESRRSSYWGGGEYAGNGYYNHPPRARNSYYDGPPRNKNAVRMNSEPAVPRHNGHSGHPYSTPGYGQTRDTVNTGGSNGSASEQWHNSTDPSSDNSSVERTKAEHGESYGYPTPPQREPIAEDGHYTYSNGGNYNTSYLNNGANGGMNGQHGQFTQQHFNNGPPPPAKAMQGGPVQAPVARQPIKLDNSGRPDIIPGGTRPAAPEKRKSWLKRTFSKK